MSLRPYRHLVPPSKPAADLRRVLRELGLDRKRPGAGFRLTASWKGAAFELRMTAAETGEDVARRTFPRNAWHVPFDGVSVARPAWFAEALPLLAGGYRRLTARPLLADLDARGADLARGLALLGLVARRLERQAFVVRGDRGKWRRVGMQLLGTTVGNLFLFALIPWQFAAAMAIPLVVFAWRTFRRERWEVLVTREETPELRLTDELREGTWSVTLDGPAGAAVRDLDAASMLGPDLEERAPAALDDAVAGLLRDHGIEFGRSRAVDAEPDGPAKRLAEERG